ncbi:MAG: hypothetical protein A3K10_10665 [Bacteroidetes bacterium RIFCSPLOWO2_12_FULL_31_6]|nr:MAG: hypothetical protein A3K10_10665 [Bacteroidetes bacterium RIFCSPLOWO2_12_FULL_31_6]
MKTKVLSIIIIALFSIGNFNAQTLKVDVLKSKLTWQGIADIGGHNGTIAIKEGFIEIKKGKIIGGEIMLDMKNISIIDAEDKEQEKSVLHEITDAKFFNVVAFPTAKFKITSYTNDLLVGDLTLVGITKSIEFKTTTTKIGKKLIVETVKFTVDLQNWGLKFSRWFGGNKLDNALTIQVHIETL